ncbi:hypothetical protein AX774_g6131 [Zancudomyces culisetae]|uniref:Uncharacterized protein n=1 Tax=Zancudomyces culisetae TaxID=1213189 RepID=A0A1R1PHU6_ZANCU|nr:hypothetical protein AX774_g6131 [Zancudomyces culisetae]|eukprot:OMH80432.1 hypothetical protein AX774_g6131 [Zancudomyces culisetae]
MLVLFLRFPPSQESITALNSNYLNQKNKPRSVQKSDQPMNYISGVSTQQEPAVKPNYATKIPCLFEISPFRLGEESQSS